jgi:hypothetical protein
MSVCGAALRVATQRVAAHTGQIFIKFDICVMFENLSRKLSLFKI